MIPTSGSVSSGNVTWARPGGRFPLRTLPPRAQVWAAVEDSISLGVACLISYWLTTRVLSLVYSVSADDDALGGMWAVIATVFVVRDSYAKSLAAALPRMAATLVSFALCMAYLTFQLWGPDHGRRGAGRADRRGADARDLVVRRRSVGRVCS